MSHESAKHPQRMALFEGDFPPPTETFQEAARVQEETWREEWAERHRNENMEAARRERESMLRNAQSGPLAMGDFWSGRVDGALSPREQQQQTETAEAVRRARGGLPDSPTEMPVATALPVRFS